MKEKVLINLKELKVLAEAAENNAQIIELRETIEALIGELPEVKDEKDLAKFNLMDNPIALRLKLLNELDEASSTIRSFQQVLYKNEDRSSAQRYLENISEYVSKTTAIDALDELTKIQSEFYSATRTIQLSLIQSMIQHLTDNTEQSITTTAPEPEKTSVSKTAQPSQTSATGKGQSGWTGWTSNLVTKMTSLASETKTKITDFTAEKINSPLSQASYLEQLKKQIKDLGDNEDLTLSSSTMLSLLKQYQNHAPNLDVWPTPPEFKEKPGGKKERKKTRFFPIIVERNARELSQEAQEELLQLSELPQKYCEEFNKAGISEKTRLEFKRLSSFLSDESTKEFKVAGISVQTLEELKKGTLSRNAISEFEKINVSEEALIALLAWTRIERFQKLGILKKDLHDLTTIDEEALKSQGITVSPKALSELHQSKLSLIARKQLESLKSNFDIGETILQQQSEERKARRKNASVEEKIEQSSEETQVIQELLRELGISDESIALQEAEKKTEQSYEERLLSYQKSRASQETLSELQNTNLSLETIQEFERAGISSETLAKIQRAESFQLSEINDLALKELGKPKLSKKTIDELQQRKTPAELREQKDALDRKIERRLGDLKGLFNFAIAREMSLGKALDNPLISAQLNIIKDLKEHVNRLEVPKTENLGSDALQAINDSLKDSLEKVIAATNLINEQLKDLAEEDETKESEEHPHQQASELTRSSDSDNDNDKDDAENKLQNEIRLAFSQFATTRAILEDVLAPASKLKKEPPKKSDDSTLQAIKEVGMEIGSKVKSGITTLFETREDSKSESKSSETMIDSEFSETIALKKQLELTRTKLSNNSVFMECLKKYDGLLTEFVEITDKKEKTLKWLASKDAISQINDSERRKQQTTAIELANKQLEEVKASLNETVGTLNRLIDEANTERTQIINTEEREIYSLLKKLEVLTQQTSLSVYKDIIAKINMTIPFDFVQIEKEVNEIVATFPNLSETRISFKAENQKEKLNQYILSFETQITKVNQNFLLTWDAAKSQLTILKDSQTELSLAQIKAKNPSIEDNVAQALAKEMALNAVEDLSKRLDALNPIEESRDKLNVCYTLDNDELKTVYEEINARQLVIPGKFEMVKSRAESQEVGIVRKMMKIAAEKLPQSESEVSSNILTNIGKALNNQLDAYLTLDAGVETTQEKFISTCISKICEELTEENLMKLSQLNKVETFLMETINSLMDALSDLAQFLNIPVSPHKSSFSAQFFASPVEKDIAKAAEEAHGQLTKLQDKVATHLPQDDTQQPRNRPAAT